MSAFFIRGPPSVSSIGEDVPVGFALPGHEKIQDLILEREEILEETLKLVCPPPARLAEILELVLEDLFPGAPVDHQEDDVEHEAGLLDVDLTVIGLSIDGGLIRLRLVARAVLHFELEGAGDDDLRARRDAHGLPELGRAAELREVLRRQLEFRRRFDHFELRLLVDLLLQEAVELGLEVDVLETLVARALRVLDDD